jgi:hypothetical protein
MSDARISTYRGGKGAVEFDRCAKHEDALAEHPTFQHATRRAPLGALRSTEPEALSAIRAESDSQFSRLMRSRNRLGDVANTAAGCGGQYDERGSSKHAADLPLHMLPSLGVRQRRGTTWGISPSTRP